MNYNPDATSTPDTAPETTAPKQSPAPSPSPSPDQGKLKASKKPAKFLVGGIIAGALILLGGGGALAYTMWYQNPDKVVHDAIINSIQAKAVSMAGTMNFKSDDANFELTFDSKSSEAGDGEFNVNAKISFDYEGAKQNLNIDGSGRIVDNTLYFKVGGIKSLVEEMAQDGDTLPAFASSIVDKIDNKWISVDPADYAEMSEEVSEQQECTTNLIKKVQSDKGMKKEVADLYRDNQILVVKEELGSKSINGTASLGYEIGFDQGAALSFTSGLKNTKLGAELKNCNEDINFDELADEFTDVDEKADDSMNGKVELWVSRFGHSITEVNVSAKNKEGNNETVNAVLQPTFNSTDIVEAPKDAISIKDLIEELQGAIMQSYMNGMDDSFMMNGDSGLSI